MSVSLRGDVVQGFDTRWDEVLLSTEDVPSDKYLERQYKMQAQDRVRKCTIKTSS